LGQSAWVRIYQRKEGVAGEGFGYSKPLAIPMVSELGDEAVVATTTTGTENSK
jgi:hypothetical protein